jgi:hypothetical protein
MTSIVLSEKVKFVVWLNILFMIVILVVNAFRTFSYRLIWITYRTREYYQLKSKVFFLYIGLDGVLFNYKEYDPDLT